MIRQMRHMPQAATGIVVCLLAVVAAGCGGGEEASPPATTAATVRESLPDLVDRVKGGIVRVETTTCDGAGVGTGFLVGPQLVATVEHVVEGAARIRLTQSGKSLGSAQVIGVDRDRDLALLRLAKRATGRHVFAFAGKAPRVGDGVIALGFPLGLPLTLTRGTVSGLQRSIPIEGVRRRALVQTDAAVSPGNSGGPLLRIDSGEVVGLIDLDATMADGLAFAVSAAVAAPLIRAWKTAPQVHALAGCAVPLPVEQASGKGSGSGNGLVALTPRVTTPDAPYRCVTPWARDHDSRMALYLRYANETPLVYVSSGPGDTAAEFVLCGGSASVGRYGLASAPIRFSSDPALRRITRVTGIVGADREASAGQRVQLDMLYAGQLLCRFSTDAAGHAKRFACTGFPTQTNLADLELRLRIDGDRDHGVYGGIAELRAEIES